MTNGILPLSLAVITFNEEKNLYRCLESVKGLVSEIVVVDSGSTDTTIQIAEVFDAHVYQKTWLGHVAQKNIALSKCTQPWVISLDADEAISEDLRCSIVKIFDKGEPEKDGYWINRKNYYLGAWIEHAWFPEWRLRMVKRENALWKGLIRMTNFQ